MWCLRDTVTIVTANTPYEGPAISGAPRTCCNVQGWLRVISFVLKLARMECRLIKEAQLYWNDSRFIIILHNRVEKVNYNLMKFNYVKQIHDKNRPGGGAHMLLDGREPDPDYV